MPGRTTVPVDAQSTSTDAMMHDAPPSAQPDLAPDSTMDEAAPEEEDDEEELEPQRVRIV